MWCLAGILSVLSAAAQAGIIIYFGYRITPAGTPLTQVYNNGHRTYFILAEGTDAGILREMAGSIRVTRDGKAHPLALDLSSAHPSIAGVPERIALNIGGRQATVTYVGNLERPGAAKAPAIEEAPPILAVQRPSIRILPVQEAQGNEEDRGAEASPPIPAAPEGMPDNRTEKVSTEGVNPAAGAPPAGAENLPDESAAAEDAEVAEYRVRIPFAVGRTTLGKEGEKAMAEIAQISPIAREIRILAPGDPGSAFQRAHGRGAEIHRLLARSGLLRQRISIEAVDAMPDGKVVHAEVALIVDLGKARK
jgi:hypothetical protein